MSQPGHSRPWVTRVLLPVSSLPCWEPPEQHQGKGKAINLPQQELECHFPVLVQENISCDKSHSLIVGDDVTCNQNGEGV